MDARADQHQYNPYRVFSRAQWAKLRDDTPMTLDAAEIATLRSMHDRLDLQEVEEIYLPLSRLLRLSLFQMSVGMALVLLICTLNRVMIVELGIPAWLVSLMIAIPLLAAPFRALIGHKSDVHRSVLGWRRVPFIWFGTLMQFGGLAIMPFALLLMARPELFAIGTAASALAFASENCPYCVM